MTKICSNEEKTEVLWQSDICLSGFIMITLLSRTPYKYETAITSKEDVEKRELLLFFGITSAPIKYYRDKKLDEK